MRALVYNGPRDVSVVDRPDPKIEKPTDAIVRITTTNICGSDLHMYEGRTSMPGGSILGHENLGEVIEVGNAVERVRKGDRVAVPFNVACGCCENCERGFTGACLRANPDGVGAAYGFAEMGPYAGGQAEYLRVPYADFNCLILPADAAERENDYVMLADIFPTGYHATELAGLQPGESVVIYGAGPVGLMAAYSAVLRGAYQVMVVDTQKDRLALAEQIGAIPIDDTEQDGVDQVLELTNGKGADRGCECVGYQCFNCARRETPGLTMNNLIQAVKPTGGIGAVGVFMPEDPGGATDLAKEGKIPFDIGMFFYKGQQFASGQCHVKRYNRYLMHLIHSGKATPSFIISHELPLEQAPEGYKNFDERNDGWTKVVLKPGT
ncbi:glutathione-independent formaldehyde dehydrogenase [Cognatilysobacter terrigena]|uniref:glutathione-independent formaldehyde dehydrogenase n=1 Tax=Cognatilysobacter terrigena TaxID=2488749 RepID=UPI00105F2142|nr:glutathione-independent formaldehyde dehydrogenase [Lysobacter terrigena]